MRNKTLTSKCEWYSQLELRGLLHHSHCQNIKEDLSAVEQGSCYLSIDIAGYLASAEDLWSAVTK